MTADSSLKSQVMYRMQDLIGFSWTNPHHDYFTSAIKHALWSFVEDLGRAW